MTTFTDPDENRTGLQIRQDPIWTVQLSAPNTGTAITVSNQNSPVSIGPGNYGATTVNSGYTLILNAAGSYGFVSLDLEPGAIVQIASPAGTTISVNSTLILRAPLGGTGMIFAYLGSATAHVEAAFTGDLFLAPSADIEIKETSTGHFFGKNVTLFESKGVSAPALSDRSQQLIRPTEQRGSTGNGQFDTSSLPPGLFTGEISTAIMTPNMNGACPGSTAFMTINGAALMFEQLSNLGMSSPATLANFPNPSPAPAACIGKILGGQDTPPWPILSGGTPSYSDVGAAFDNVSTRLDAGRVVSTGFSLRYCDDPTPPDGPGCPSAQPAGGSACDPSTTTGSCSYGSAPATRCACRTSCGAGGTTCSVNSDCCSQVCTGAKVCTNGAAPAFYCASVRRLEAGIIGVRMSTSCGTSWTAGALDWVAIDPATFGNERGRDRPEVYFDPFDKKLYVSELLANPDPVHTGIFSAPTSSVSSGSNFSWSAVRNTTEDPQTVHFPIVMTTALDEQALFPDGSHGRWVHFVTARCMGNHELVEIDTPFGHRTVDLFESADPASPCQDVDIGRGGLLFRPLHGGPSVVGVSSSPPSVHVAYTGRNPFTGFEIINVYSVPIRSTQGYDAGAIKAGAVREFRVDKSSDFRHVLWPQLIRADSLAGSDLLVDTPLLLRYGAWIGAPQNSVAEEAVAFYSGLVGPTFALANWSVPTVCGSTTSCFAGDYRYGTFFRKVNGVLTFFTPWSGQSSVAGQTGIFAQGATIDVVP